MDIYEEIDNASDLSELANAAFDVRYHGKDSLLVKVLKKAYELGRSSMKVCVEEVLT